MADRILSTLKNVMPRSLFWALQPAYHFALAFFAAIIYGFPSRRLTVIGVTGTDGKTTLVHLLHEMLAAAGYGVGSLSSLRFKVNDREEPNLLKMTMPGRFRLQKFLAQCRAAGCHFAVLEVTSQGVMQSRHRFIRFHTGVLTNVTPEHVEAHGGFERYRSSKLELFRRLPPSGWAVLNREDPSGGVFAAHTRAHVIWYSRREVELKRVGHPVRVIAVSPERIQLEVGDAFLDVGLGGEFNVMNILAAVSSAMAYGVSPSAMAEAARRIRGLPGRLEYIQREPFAAVVDYANTPAAYGAVYQALQNADGKSQRAGLICVFGAPGGGRDRWKRPKLGEIAGRCCREIILTSDDPDDEDPRAIAEEIRSGMPTDKAAEAKIIVDRREAISAGLRSARAGDTVIITGMGAQPWIVVDGKKIPWDDRQVVREEFRALYPHEH